MLPPILQQLNGTTGIQRTIDMLKGMRDPSSAMRTAMQNNPAMQQVQQYINANGGDARTAFYRLAEQKGINPNDILNLFK